MLAQDGIVNLFISPDEFSLLRSFFGLFHCQRVRNTLDELSFLLYNKRRNLRTVLVHFKCHRPCPRRLIMAERIGQQLGNYRLVSLLGEGGFADVYLGEHMHLGTQAAIKVLYIQLTSEGIEQFSREARTIARLEHPHIVHILDFGVESGTPFLIMSYAPNRSEERRVGKECRSRWSPYH